MLGWRLTNHPSLDGLGGTFASGRWHSKGRPILYLSRCASTSLLEILVRADIDSAGLPTRYLLLTIDIPDDVRARTISEDELPPVWRDDLQATRRIGDGWLAELSCAVLQVPCAIIPEINILFNPMHPDAARVRLIRTAPYRIDSRLT